MGGTPAPLRHAEVAASARGGLQSVVAMSRGGKVERSSWKNFPRVGTDLGSLDPTWLVHFKRSKGRGTTQLNCKTNRPAVKTKRRAVNKLAKYSFVRLRPLSDITKGRFPNIQQTLGVLNDERRDSSYCWKTAAKSVMHDIGLLWRFCCYLLHVYRIKFAYHGHRIS